MLVPRPPSTTQSPATSRTVGAPASLRAVLRNSPLFSHLDDSEADAVLAEARIKRYPEGTQIFAKGDPGDSMMAVLHGRVTIGNLSPDGRHLVVASFREGDVFGEMAVRSAAPTRRPHRNANCWSCPAGRFCTC